MNDGSERMILTIKPGDGDTFKKDEEEQAHATGRVVIKKLEDINAPLKGIQGENSPPQLASEHQPERCGGDQSLRVGVSLQV